MEGGIVNLPAVVVVLAVAGMLMAGTRESATLNIVLVIIKLSALAVFVALALPAFDGGNMTPFMPYGFGSAVQDGETRGVMAAAAIVFFAFYGFDAVATSAEEAKNPGRDLKIGIIGSMLVSTTIYMLVAIAAVGALAYTAIAGSAEPLSLVLRTLGNPVAASAVALAAIVALPSVILVMMYGQSRVFFVMSRDGLLPRWAGKVSAAHRIAGADDGNHRPVHRAVRRLRLDRPTRRAGQCRHVDRLHAVAACMMILRRTRPNLPRVFRCPAPFVVGSLAIAGCLYLLVSLPDATLIRFVIWNLIGLVVYFLDSRRRSHAGRIGR